MKSKMNTPAGRLAQLGVLVFALFGFAQGASASSATHIIQNTVNIAYSDAGGNSLGDSDTVDVTVRLVSGAPTVTVDPAGPIGPVAHSVALNFTYTVTSNANGLDNYTLTTNLNGATTASETSVTPTPLALGGANFSSTSGGALAATDETDGTAAGFEIVVAADNSGAGAGGEVHGFVQGDTIVFTPSGGTEYVCQVNHTVEPTFGNEINASATIYVDNCTTLGTGSLTAGDLVSERATIAVVIDSGTTNETVLLDADVTPDGEPVAGGGQTPGSAAQVTIEVEGADLRVYKFVRNVTTSANNVVASGLCTNNTDFQCLTLDGINGGADVTYYKTGVEADPGDQLEYAILLYNATSETDSIVVTDPIVAFTTYDNDAGGADATLVFYAEAIDSDGTGSCDSGNTESGTCLVQHVGGGDLTGTNFTTGTEATSDDWFQFDSNTVTASGGNDGNAGSEAAVGDVAGGQLEAAVSANDERPASVVIFKVAVDS